MPSGHDLPDAIQWHEGMLLGPQHFQQLAARLEELQHYHSLLTSPYHWGVRHLKIDPVLLVEGQFRVVELEAVMPDGLVISSLKADTAGLTLDLAEAVEDPTQGPFTVHLAVPGRRPGSSSVKGDLARFDSVEGEPVPDQNTGGGEVTIPRLRPRVRLLVGETVPEKYTSFPLARVAYVNEAFTLTSYIAPQLRVPVASPLGDLCAAIATRLREKAVFLSEKVRAPSAARRAPQLVESKALLQSLVAALPPFEAVLYSGTAHPFALYVSTCSLVGHLAALGTSLVPPALKAYDHNDLYATFRQATDFADRVIREGFIESHAAYPFRLEAGVFSLPFEPDWAGRPLIVGVRAPSGASEREAASWIENAQIASESGMPSVRQRRILGIPRHASEGEGELVPTRGVTLYSLPADSELLVAGERLLVANADDPEGRHAPAEIVLYVRNPPRRDDEAGR